MNNKRVTTGLTDVLYEDDAYMSECPAKVLECRETIQKTGDREELLYAIVLDKTVFFPEGGGQPADVGVIENEAVVDVQKENGVICHYVRVPFEIGKEVTARIDFGVRYRRMQNHSGEHLFCGILHRLYGLENVGFHMSEDSVTVDVNGSLTAEDFEKLEALANNGIRENVPITVVYPETPDELDYRSKLELTEDIRVVLIEGYDACACCAPHVKSTAEIELIKVMDFMSHRGGTRFTLKCGADAVDDYVILHEEIRRMMRLFSAKREECHMAAERVCDQIRQQQESIMRLKKQITELHMEKLRVSVAQNTGKKAELIFDESLDDAQMRALINEGVTMVPGIVAGFIGKDTEGYRYIIGKNESAEEPDLRALAGEMNSELNGRGGGSVKMIQGSVAAKRSEIEAFFNDRLS